MIPFHVDLYNCSFSLRSCVSHINYKESASPLKKKNTKKNGLAIGIATEDEVKSSTMKEGHFHVHRFGFDGWMLADDERIHLTGDKWIVDERSNCYLLVYKRMHGNKNVCGNEALLEKFYEKQVEDIKVSFL